MAEQRIAPTKTAAGIRGWLAAFAAGAARVRLIRRNRVTKHCTHLATIKKVHPSARGCEECLKIGQEWVHLRICRTCGHVGCCDQSIGKHATKHFHATRHPIMEGYDPPEGWGWCYVDDLFIDLGSNTTPQDGPIPRYA
jgi:hypothetical protein